MQCASLGCSGSCQAQLSSGTVIIFEAGSFENVFSWPKHELQLGRIHLRRVSGCGHSLQTQGTHLNLSAMRWALQNCRQHDMIIILLACKTLTR